MPHGKCDEICPSNQDGKHGQVERFQFTFFFMNTTDDLTIAIPLKIIKYEKTNVVQWTSLNAEQKVNLWKSINLEELLHGQSTLINLLNFSSAIDQWIEIVSFLGCVHVDCACMINNETLHAAAVKF